MCCYYLGININAPCCELGQLCTSLSNSFCRACYGAKAQTFLCNKRSLCFYPLCPMICTCGMRPFTKKSDYIITDQTIYYFDYKSNKPWIKCPAVEGETFVGTYCDIIRTNLLKCTVLYIVQSNVSSSSPL